MQIFKRNSVPKSVKTRLLSLLAAAAAAGLTIMMAAPADAAPDRRVALVIGNGAYKNAVTLPNAPKDARAIADKLRQLGFVVVEGIDLTQDGMTGKLKEFNRELNSAQVGMFYYAGHGMQISGENYLLPIDAALKNERDVDFETMKVDLVVKQMAREAKIKLVVLDACRDNPLAEQLSRSMVNQGRSRSATPSVGLSSVDVKNVDETLFAFATAPGTVALDGKTGHSPFTEALLQHIDEPGVDIEGVMKKVRIQVAAVTNAKQQPWTNSSLISNFYFNPVAPQAPKPAGDVVANLSPSAQPPASTTDTARSTTQSFDSRQLELPLWAEAKSNNSISGYESYLKQFPSGTFADVARENIAKLKSGSASTSGVASSAIVLTDEQKTAASTILTENELKLDDDRWMNVQKALTGVGFSTNGIDGKAGNGTRTAIHKWQTARGYNVSGFLNQPQMNALLSEPRTVKTPATESADNDEAPVTRRAARQERPERQERSSRSNDGGAGAAAVGAFMGGVVGGVLRNKLPF